MSLTYSSYLRIPDLVALQTPRSDPPEHDEMLFIVIHQVYELWFRLILHELERLNERLSGGHLFDSIATLKRIRMVLKTLVAQVDVLETMTPLSFRSFRDRLESASGFQSVQFREIEFLLGQKRPQMLRHHEGHEAAMRALEQRLEQPAVMDHLYDFLALRGAELPAEVLERDVREPTQAHPAVQKAILSLYRNDPAVRILFEMMTDVDEGLQEWRYRHVKMVERTIGDQPGTGGSPGVEFLKKTLFRPVFPDLWAIRGDV